jgi:hypothetical protein
MCVLSTVARLADDEDSKLGFSQKNIRRARLELSPSPGLRAVAVDTFLGCLRQVCSLSVACLLFVPCCVVVCSWTCNRVCPCSLLLLYLVCIIGVMRLLLGWGMIKQLDNSRRSS